MSRVTVLAALFCSLIGCVGASPLAPGQPCPCAPGWSCDTSHQVCMRDDAGLGGADSQSVADSGDVADSRNVADSGDVADSGGSDTGGFDATVPGEVYTPADVQAALAQCNLPHGSVVSTTTYGDKRAVMLGAWIECPPRPATVFYPGIVFAADGTWQRLLSDSNGGLVLGTGVDNQGAYSFPYPDTDATNGNPYVEVIASSMDTTPANYASAVTTLEASPSRMHVSFSYIDQTYEVWSVRLP